MTLTAPGEQIVTAFKAWTRQVSRKTGFPARGTMGGALVVLERLRLSCELDIDKHTTQGGGQVISVSKVNVQRILQRYNETRVLGEELRTNLGLRGDVKTMLTTLKAAGLDALPPEHYDTVIRRLQQVMVDTIRDFYMEYPATFQYKGASPQQRSSSFRSRNRLEVIYDPAKSTRQLIREMIATAQATDKGGAVAQHLVGAKLAQRFPGISVRNESFSTADAQLDRAGDFEIGDTVFHVTLSPMPKVYDKCVRNLNAGLRVYLLVPDQVVFGARQTAELYAQGRIAVESIESFVGQNIEELSEFATGELREEFRQLLETYNQRVTEVEADRSALIEIPANLTRAPSVRRRTNVDNSMNTQSDGKPRVNGAPSEEDGDIDPGG